MTPNPIKHCLVMTVATGICTAMMVLHTGPAHAAPAFNQNSSRSNNAKAGVAGTDSARELSSKLDELDSLMKSLDEQLAQLGVLSAAVSSVGDMVVSDMGSETEAQAEARPRLEIAKKMWLDEIAPLMDSDVAALVSASLDAQLRDMETSPPGDDPGVSISANLDELTAALQAIQDQVTESKKVVEKATSGLKDTLKTQV